MLSTLRSDLAYAVRMIVKTPVVTLIAIVSMSVAIAANTSIFSILNSWMLRPLPYANADRMVLSDSATGLPNTRLVFTCHL